MKFCLGPMSKTIVDVAIASGEDITFIPSRRQIDYNGGYVGWTTAEFARYVNGRAKIQRDHGGPGQGEVDDDGFRSLEEDCRYFDSIHIDPWKKYPEYSDGLEMTIRMIEFCSKHSSTVQFEVGTEQSIRPFSVEEVDRLLNDLKTRLNPALFSRIEYVVIQCGTQLLEGVNVGSFDEEKLTAMLSVVHGYGKIAKEHNGDWVSQDVLRRKEALGLRYVNIAPELGENETRVLMKHVDMFDICVQSGKWKKWVSPTFDPYANKEEVILICGHYVNNHPEVAKVRESIDAQLREQTETLLYKLWGVYWERTQCIFCKSSNLKRCLESDTKSPVCVSMHSTLQKRVFVPFNIQMCQDCGAAQTQYLVDVALVYAVNHIDTYGTTKSMMFTSFASFINENPNVRGILEGGGSTDTLARCVNTTHPYTIVDPGFCGTTESCTVVPAFIENVDIDSIDANTLVMSNMFEHIYDPVKLIQKIRESKIEYVVLNHPDMEYAMKTHVPINLNIEHTFYIETQYLIDLFSKHGFACTRKSVYGKNHTIMVEFARSDMAAIVPRNVDADTDISLHYQKIHARACRINELLRSDRTKTYYIWPAAMFALIYFVHGLDHTLFEGVLDNSPNKIGKYAYGYDLKCLSFKEVVESNDPNVRIVITGSEQYCAELFAIYPSNLSMFILI